MNAKRIWLMIPAILNPYMFLIGILGVYFFPQIEFITENNFFASYGIFIWYGFFLLFGLTAIVLSVVCFILSIKHKWNAVSLAKTAMIIKLIQIPAYIAVFALGVGFVASIWLIALIGMLVFADYITLVMSSSLSVAAVVNAIKDNKMTLAKGWWIIVLQFIFCADVVASIVLYRYLKKLTNPVAHDQQLEN